jgi:hypothetical protein
MAAYYPRRVARFADLQKAYPGFETYDDFEEDRIESVAITKSRGKGAPKKKRTAAGKWEKIKRQRWRKKRTLLISIQSRRSLARRRGRRCAPRELLCFAIYPAKAKARACKNTHRYMDFKSRGKEHWASYEERGVSRSSLGCSFTYLARGINSPCTKSAIFNHHAKQAHRVLYGISESCSGVANFCAASTRQVQSSRFFLWERHITSKGVRQLSSGTKRLWIEMSISLR